MKTIAMYLPQFHRIKENDEWWGEGFTDWVSAKNANPLFEGHYQPHEPLNDNYYDLLDKKTMVWQADLAKKYGIDGFCFYHYWFKDGKTVLEKPAENLLRWKDIDINFCFSWDSNAWVRTWSRLNYAYSWSSHIESAKDNKNSNGLLMEQKFGREEAWKKHFDYLLPFFKDERYIKKDSKPVFVLYNAQNIYCLDDMLDYWDTLSIKAGFNGIYSIATNCDESKWDNVDASLMQEPGTSMSIMNANRDYTISEHAKSFDGDLLLRNSLENDCNNDRSVYYGGFVGYDDSPRRKPGNIIEGITQTKYQNYLYDILLKNYYRGNEFTFINAWNEWGEGMHLEPDKLNGYAYLEATKSAINKFKLIDKSKAIEYTIDNTKEGENSSQSKMHEYFDLMNQWMFDLEDKKSIASYFDKNNFKKIAIYGYGHFAKHLIFQLKDSEIEISYIIEQNKPQNSVPFPVKTLEEKLSAVDAVIVTPFMEYREIKNEIRNKLDCPVVSIKEVVMEM